MGVWVVTIDFWFLKIFIWYLGGPKVRVEKSFFDKKFEMDIGQLF